MKGYRIIAVIGYSKYLQQKYVPLLLDSIVIYRGLNPVCGMKETLDYVSGMANKIHCSFL
jgi:hypothetical protein